MRALRRSTVLAVTTVLTTAAVGATAWTSVTADSQTNPGPPSTVPTLPAPAASAGPLDWSSLAAPVRVTDEEHPAAAVRGGDGSYRRLPVTAARPPAADTRTPVRAALSTGRVATAAAHRSYRVAAHQVTMALVVPAGVRAAAGTNRAARAQVAGASAYWREQSRGSVAFATSSVTAYRSEHGCGDVFALWSEAVAKTKFVAGPNRHLLVAVPPAAYRAGCPYGLATVGAGVNAGGMVFVSEGTWPVLAHEIGHNLGLDHANALRCTRPDVKLTGLPRGCAVSGYGDPFDVMAASARNNAGSLSMSQAYWVGFLRRGEFAWANRSIQTITLRPVAGLSGLRAVRVIDPRTKAAYTVEYRTRKGRDRLLYADMTAGVRVLRDAPGSNGAITSLALDASPTAREADYTRHIPAGGRFTSYSGGVVVDVLAATPSAATVRVGSLPPKTMMPSLPAPKRAAR